MVIKKSGFTLVELLLVITILAILMVMMVGIINPVALINKGYDARRKKDVKRIQAAMEEYANDKKSCFPVSGSFDFSGYTCNSDFFSPWLASFPCDPRGNRYLISVDTTSGTCPKWFKVTAKLDNLTDIDIPAGWKYDENISLGDGMTQKNSNFGKSSTNVNWYDAFADPYCPLASERGYYEDIGIGCYSDYSVSCQSAAFCRLKGNGDYKSGGCVGNHCFIKDNRCKRCKVSCCGFGCNYSLPNASGYECESK